MSAKIDYLAAKTNFKYVCYKAKKKSWRNHCDQITTPKQFAALNRCLKNKTSADIGLLLNSRGEYSRSPQETIRILTETHLPGCRPHEPPKHAPSINARWCNENGSIRSCSRNDLVNSFITETAVPTAIKSFGSQKAPGPDGLIPMALQCFIKNNNALKRLCRVYQAMLELQYTPEHWCSSKLIFIPKPNKDYRLAKSFRPISLMPFLFKTCEKLANWEIEQKILINRPFSINQHAFRKNFSTDTAVSNLIDGIESHILRGQIALVVFLDVEGAFNNIPYTSIINAMKKREIPDKIIYWYKDFLETRTSTVNLKGFKSTVKITRGTAQGSTLSPTLWNLIFDDLLAEFSSGAAKINGFADDACILIGGFDQFVIRDIMQDAMKTVVRWGDRHQLNFVAAKTSAVFFHRNRKFKLPPVLKLKDSPIAYASEATYLGITLDSKLTWNLHANNKMNNAKKAL